jgi:hypothetical protein
MYGKCIWEWIELPTSKNNREWGNPERYKTKKEAREKALKFLKGFK